MRARWLCLAAVSIAPLLVGCGSGGISSASSDALARQLTVYSSLPLEGASAALSRQIVAGERLALADAGGRVGRLRIKYLSLDDSSPRTGAWDPGITEANAKLAARDPSAIAYLGDYDSPATAVSLPILNLAGILQVSPASPYVGLTSSLDAGEDEPERFYPTGARTFGRVAPGDPVQAAAQVALMRALGIRSVYVLSDQNPFDGPLAQLVAADASRAGIEVQGQDTLDVPAAHANFTGEALKVGEKQPAAVFYSGLPITGADDLFTQLHQALPHSRLLGSASLSTAGFVSQLGGAGAVTLLGTPALPLARYPPAAQRVLSLYSHRFGHAPSAYVLYGYEAMSVVLDAVRAAAAHGNDRRSVVQSFFATRRRRSVLGAYSVLPSGETTLSAYGIERVRGGRPVFWRSFSG